MEKYVIFETTEDSNASQCGCCPLTSWNTTPMLRTDGCGNPMVVVKEFEAETWEAAMQVYYDHYDFGKYVPMSDEQKG